MADLPTGTLEVFLFRLNNWSVEKEKLFIEKLKEYDLYDFSTPYSVPNHPEIKGVYFIPAEIDAVTRVRKLSLENTSIDVQTFGSYDPKNIPDSLFGIEKSNYLPYMILGIIILIILIIGVLK
ncbi:hypothetical protein [Leptospira kmetyi]|uniref:hypothetical protein n=1 Tax=Leptospira kmetyi TaxID=408139 RepID=UPI003EBF7DED